MIAQTSNAALPVAKDRTAAIAQGLAAMLFGLFVIGMVGFSHLDLAHNASHDVRHSFAFPCH